MQWVDNGQFAVSVYVRIKNGHSGLYIAVVVTSLVTTVNHG